MHILKVTQTYLPYLSKGGPPVKVSGIARELARRGHEITVLTACLTDAEADVPLNAPTAMSRSGSWVATDRGIETVYLPTLLNYRATTINPGVLRFCRRRLSEFDVVHIYGLYDALGWAVARACRRRGLPYVLEPLGMFGGKIRSRRKKQLYQRLIGNKLFRGAHRIIATSLMEKQELISGGVDPEQIVLRRNGVDLSQFRELPPLGRFRARLGIAKDQPLLLFVGRLSFIKGLDLLVEALAKFAEADSRESVLVLAGANDGDGCLQRVQELVARLKLDGRVIQLGPIYGEEKLEALVDADLFVLPSRYESFGNAAAEAIAAHTPVLVTQECGIAPLVGEAGVVVPCQVDALRDGLMRMLGEPESLAKVRAECAAVAAGLSWDEPVDLMESVYQDAVSPNRESVMRKQEWQVVDGK